MVAKSLRPGTIRYVSSEIERIVEELNADETHSQMAHNMFKQTLEVEYDLISLDSIVPACVYLADRVTQPQLSLSEIETVSRCDLNKIRSTAKKIRGELGLEIRVQTPENVLKNKLEDLGLENREPEFQRILRKVDDTYKGSKSPVSVAAALVYTVANVQDLDLTQTEISNEFDVSEVTIRNRYPEILKNSSIQPPKDKRNFKSFDEAFTAFNDDLDIPGDILKRAKAHVTLEKNDLEPGVSKAGIVLAAIAEAATEEYGETELKDAERLAELADVTANTINRHRDKFDTK